MTEPDRASRSKWRLAEELEEDRIVLAADGPTASVVFEELDYARRTPMFEGRRPVYGSIITPTPEALGSLEDVAVDVVDGPCDLADARGYADGRSSYLLRDPSNLSRVAVACFDRAFQYESDLVLLQEEAGALIVQRTAVFGVTRLFQDGQVVSWDGRSWTSRATAQSLLATLQAAAPDLDPAVADGLLTLAVHWLAPARAGATFVVNRGIVDDSLDTSSASTPPGLTLTNRRHFAPLWSYLLQRDLATLVDAHGRLQATGVGLRASEVADATISSDLGMRHRSAQRWSLDHPDAVVAVVSADGPVTVYLAGESIIGRG